MPQNPVLEKVYDPHEVEPAMYALWEQSGAFRATPDGSPHERTFTIMIPLPNVTGALHLGHALNNTLQDVLIRYHRMRGFNTLWQPGTDHAGIATQAVVERRIFKLEGKTRHDLGREGLVKRIWQWKDEYEKRIIGQLKLMGCSCDWDRTRFTLDDGLARAVRHQFFNLFKDGLIFRGKRLVNWDTELQTAVSDDEVYYENVKGHFWHFKYPVIDPKPGEPEHVIIATTRPETMLADTAVAVHPDPEGFFNKQEAEWRDATVRASGKERSELQAKLERLGARRESHLAALVQLRDMAKDGRVLLLPLVERKIPLICDEWAKPDLGSGCVKITPAHDPNDYEVGLRHNLPMVNVLTPDGKIARIIEPDGGVNPQSGEYEARTFAGEGREKVVADLEARSLLHEVEDHDVEISHSDRSKTPVEPYLSDQWFVRTGDIPEPQASACADAVVSKTPQQSSRLRPRSPALSFGATLLTWTTYGGWLPGDDRGSVSRAPRADGTQSLRNLPGEPYDRDDPQRQAAAREGLEGKPVRLNREHASILLSCIADTCERHEIELLAIAIMANHVHVLCQGEQYGAEMLQLIKGNASRWLNKQFTLEESPRWWTRSGSRRRIQGGADLTGAIEYVKSREYPLLVWSFDVDSGEAARIVEEARRHVEEAAPGTGETLEDGRFAQAEARGSGGVRLGDGTKAPGLAQAAINAVEDGRIRVFPSRYAKSYLDWLGEKRDWCISRQLWWGHRIPVWHATVRGFEATATSAQIQESASKLRRQLQQALDALPRPPHAGCPFRVVWHPGLPAAECFICTVSEAADAELHKIEAVVSRSGFTETHSEDSPSPRAFPGGHPRWLLRRLSREDDVLDTWFSSGLWPLSTLGWPEQTDSLKEYYPGTVLVTSRDIITNWVARMVMFGLYAMGDIPFDHVYVHPKILDGRGETMSKSKGNGVDPVDVIHTHGADALRYAMADMTTETQDIRMPVEYVCPHCGKLTDQFVALKREEQARKSRGEKLSRKLQPADCLRVQCANKECDKEFATQWADDSLKKELGLARETSDKFDIGRNFCNKLWNAARFAFMNLEGTPCRKLDVADLLPEDRWILARLSRTIRRYHECMANYQFSASVKELREFFWDALCDWYIELTKPRITPEPQLEACVNSMDSDDSRPTGGAVAKQVLAFCLDQILRLWHPTIPFITERLWQQLNTLVPKRGLPGIADLATDRPLVLSEFPPVESFPGLEDEGILTTFAELQDATRGVRDLRAGCGVPPRDRVKVTVAVPADHAHSFKTNAHIVRHMAGIAELFVDPGAKRPKNAGSISVHGLRIYVHDVSDDEAERQRATKALDQIGKQIAGKEAKLANEKFVANAKPEVVDAERRRLADLTAQRERLQEHLAELAD